MIDSPFSTLIGKPIHVNLLTKEDRIATDADVAERLGIGMQTLATIKQEHGGKAVRVDSPTSREIKADGFFTDVKGLTLALRAADCQNFAVYDPVHHVCGLIHAGWRSVLAEVIPHSIELMKREWNSDPKTLLVGAGPSLCMRCSEFTDPVRELPGLDADLFDGRSANLREAAERQFDAAGVPRKNRERSPDCTKCNPEKYWTYRGGDKAAVLQGLENVLTCVLH